VRHHGVQLAPCGLIRPHVVAPRLRPVEIRADVLFGITSLGLCLHGFVWNHGSALDDPSPQHFCAVGRFLLSDVGHAGPGVRSKTMPDEPRKPVRVLFVRAHDRRVIDDVCRGSSQHPVGGAFGVACVPAIVPKFRWILGFCFSQQINKKSARPKRFAVRQEK